MSLLLYPQSVTQIAQAVKLTPSRCHQILNELKQKGFVKQVNDSRPCLFCNETGISRTRVCPLCDGIGKTKSPNYLGNWFELKDEYKKTIPQLVSVLQNG